MHRRTSTLHEKVTFHNRQVRAAVARVAREIGAQFRALRSVPLPRFRPSRARHAQPQPILPLPSRSTVTAALVACGFLAAVIALVSATAAAPSPPVTTATADRQAAADRADRAARDAPAPSSAASSSPPAAPSPAAAQAAPARVLDWVSPMPGTPLSSCFGWRWGALHQGIDFAGDPGTEIHSAGAGTVFGAGWLYSGYGISVVIDHGNGLYTHYAHLSQVLVSEGQTVAVGQVIGLEGSTGDSTGPHLHFEVHQGLWNQIDPAAWLRAHGVPAAC